MRDGKGIKKYWARIVTHYFNSSTTLLSKVRTTKEKSVFKARGFIRAVWSKKKSGILSKKRDEFQFVEQRGGKYLASLSPLHRQLRRNFARAYC